MSNLKNKVQMDEKLAEIIRDYYRFTAPTEELTKVCFSNPQLRSHVCNRLEPLEGGVPCDACNHNTKIWCVHSCDISKACLATLAYRLGVGGKDLHKAVKKNLKMEYEDLVDKIKAKFRGEPVEEEVAEIEKVAEVVPPVVEQDEPEVERTEEVEPEVGPEMHEKAPEPVSESVEGEPQQEEAPKAEIASEEVITVAEAAEFMGCTKPNVYTLIKHGRLQVAENPNSKNKSVSKSSVVEYLRSKGK